MSDYNPHVYDNDVENWYLSVVNDQDCYKAVEDIIKDIMKNNYASWSFNLEKLKRHQRPDVSALRKLIRTSGNVCPTTARSADQVVHVWWKIIDHIQWSKCYKDSLQHYLDQFEKPDVWRPDVPMTATELNQLNESHQQGINDICAEIHEYVTNNPVPQTYVRTPTSEEDTMNGTDISAPPVKVVTYIFGTAKNRISKEAAVIMLNEAVKSRSDLEKSPAANTTFIKAQISGITKAVTMLTAILNGDVV